MGRTIGDLEDLRRAVARLDRLDDQLLCAADGPLLVDIVAVREPARLLAACRAGALDLAAVRAGLELRRDPRPLHGALLARAHRDLKAIEGSTEHRALVLDAPRSLRRGVTRGSEWLAARWRRLDQLRAALASAQPHAGLARHCDDPGPDLSAIAARSPWLATALDLAAAAYGPDSARAALDLLRRSLSHGTAPRRDARRRVDALLRRLAGPPRPPAAGRDALELALADLVRDARAPASSRQRDRNLRRAVLAAVCWPAAPPADDLAPAIELPVTPAGPGLADKPFTPDADMLAALRRYAAAAIDVVHAPPDLRELDAAVALAALAFPIDPGEPAWGRAELALAARLGELRQQLDAPGLRLCDALWLARRDHSEHVRSQLAGWLAAGLPRADIEAVIACGAFDQLQRIDDVDTARRFCFWVTRLVPQFKRSGIDLELQAAQFATLPAHRRGELGLLALCLLQHQRPVSPAAVQRELSLVDTTLGLFRGVPHTARALLARLDAAPPGLGRSLHPRFAEWLGDDVALDHYCHLRRLLGESTDLSHNLRSDFAANDRLAGQVEHLRALPAPTEAQRQLLARLADKLARAEPPRPDWTRRRLAEQVDALRARAFRQQLDAALREVLRATFTVDLPELTPTWRDVVRFYLAGDWSRRDARNRQLLGDLLRAVTRAPGQPVTRDWLNNRAWLDAARARFDVDAWLRPRARPCRVGARPCRLEVEDDPLEVLRMGVPFDTCLSLRDGSNASSAVVNAVDVNKRVIYLRGEDGAILARQLLAVNEEFGLLRYDLYSALAPADGDEVTRLFDQVFQDIARETGLKPTDEGAPASLHGGFWYDDGALATGEVDGLDELFAELRLPAPPQLEPYERRQLHAHAVLRRGDAQAALALLGEHSPPLERALARLAVAGLGEPECRARALRSPSAALAVVHHILSDHERRPDPCARLREALEFASRLAPHARIAGVLTDADALTPASGALAHAWLAAAERQLARGDDSDDGVAHHAFDIARHLAALPLAELLDLADRLAAHWDRLVGENSYCNSCRDRASNELAMAAEAAYRRAPDPRPILRRLRVGAATLATRLALHVAARYPLDLRDARAPTSDKRRRRRSSNDPSAMSESTCPKDNASPANARPVPADISLRTPSEYDLHTGAEAAALARLSRPLVPSAEATRLLQALRRRRPELAATPEFVAAAVRHCPPGVSLDLPALAASPLPVCAELVLHAGDQLAQYAEPGVSPADWRPDRWELALHRRLTTRWRRRVSRAAQAGDTSASKWLRALANPSPSECAALFDGLTGPLPAIDLASFARPPVDPAGIDPGACALAFRTFRAALAGDAPIEASRQAVELLLATATTPTSSLRLALLDELLACPRGAAHEPLAVALFKPLEGQRLLTARQILGVWALPAARPFLIAYVTQTHGSWIESTLHELMAVADRDTVLAILTAWFARQAATDQRVDPPENIPSAWPLVIRAALDGAGAAGLLSLYNDSSLDGQLKILAILADEPPATLAAIREALAADPVEQPSAGRSWLEHRCAPASPPADAPTLKSTHHG